MKGILRVAYFEFEQEAPNGELMRFVFKLVDSARIAEAREILSGKSSRNHVRGKIVAKRVPYNPGWSFHLDPPTINFFEMAIEVCDANVTYVEEHLAEIGGDTLPGNIWCPWSSRLSAEVTNRIDPATEEVRR